MAHDDACRYYSALSWRECGKTAAVCRLECREEASLVAMVSHLDSQLPVDVKVNPPTPPCEVAQGP